MKRGKIILTPFPFTDLKGHKLRPALVVSSSARTGTDVIIAFISSVYPSAQLTPADEPLLATDPDFAATGLRFSSVFKMGKLATVNRSIVLGELGEVSAALQAKLDAKLKIALALP